MGASPYLPAARSAAAKYGIPEPIFLRQINQESGWNPNARSSAGAMGLLQLMPGTARGLGVTNPFDPVENIDAGARYLRDQYNHFGSWRLALAAYNAGPGNVSSGAWQHIPETVHYVDNILAGIEHSMSSSAPSATPGLPRSLPQPTPGAGLPPAAFSALLSIASGGAPSENQMLALLGSPQQSSVSVGHVTLHGVNPSSGVDAAAVDLVRSYVGTPYVWGGESPKGFDCSGLLQFVWGKEGVSIPRTTYDQFRAGKAVSVQNLRPGDAVFFTGSDPRNGLPGHVGMYIGGGRFIEAPHTGARVQISTLAGRSDFVGARRYA